jgi:hypothetical protein
VTVETVEVDVTRIVDVDGTEMAQEQKALLCAPGWYSSRGSGKPASRLATAAGQLTAKKVYGLVGTGETFVALYYAVRTH